MSSGAREAEAKRQAALVTGILSRDADASTLPTRESGARALRGLQAYRVNAHASAERALGAAFPTVRQLIGEEDFDRFAQLHWRDEPPARGDLAEWGAAFAAWLSSQQPLREWPYLGDCAKLDWAMHRCERAADADFDASSATRLGDTDPSRLAVVLMPGLAVIESRWPIAIIHRAHHDAGFSFDEVRDAIAREQAESVIVSRRGWKAVHATVDDATAQWTRQLLEGCDLATALSQAGDGFDFTAWLTLAISSNWLKEFRVLGD
ncbi:HvfC/BufC N-terminal domain-containing protein [Piscinibacter terrae]|uniref:Putative DNA-binding domain-containing protein n=1 Tax=Piscinibacter terrae TaxID=2496871 RepID=A0A3N7J223_9BURK|nr:DNA-binding domain-containing protein [Albitalea terrae]RQP24982.1 hypothetical protein DZC73_08970 [Albitalea terrae]